jgi:hypothetical protein
LRWEKAAVGQASAQGAGLQAKQSLASNPEDNPPEVIILMPAVFQDNLLWTILAQAREQE